MVPTNLESRSNLFVRATAEGMLVHIRILSPDFSNMLHDLELSSVTFVLI